MSMVPRPVLILSASNLADFGSRSGTDGTGNGKACLCGEEGRREQEYTEFEQALKRVETT